MRLPRRTVRLRLTLLYCGLFVLSGACLLLITYLLVVNRFPVLLRNQAGGDVIRFCTAPTASTCKAP